MRSDSNSGIYVRWRRSSRFILSRRLGRSGNRRRRSGLTRLGRLTLVVVVLGVLGAGWGTRYAWQGWRSDSHRERPHASAAPPPPSIAGPWIDDPPRSRERFFVARTRAGVFDPSALPRLVEWLNPIGPASYLRSGDEFGLASIGAASAPGGFRNSSVSSRVDGLGALRIEYSLDEALTEEVFEIFRRGRVERGQAIVLDPRSGRILAYVSTDLEALPPERTYPAASLVKVLTAATLLQEAPAEVERGCTYRGNKYRLSRRRLKRPKSGHETTLARALASSNNQCFSQWAVQVLGEEKLRSTFERFGWLSEPAPGHEAGRLDPVETSLDLGRLGSGLDGIRINPLHVASLASILTHGNWIEPWWIDRVVDSQGRSLAMPPRSDARPVISKEIASRLRTMLIGTTTRGTAKSSFQTRRGKRLLGEIDVAGKTGNLTGSDPYGRYEWFLGLAPAENPTIAVVVLQLQSNLWWSRSSQLAANVLRTVFCDEEGCRTSRSDRLTGDLSDWTDPLLMSELERPLFISRSD